MARDGEPRWENSRIVLAPESFRVLLARERACSDRTGIPFCVIAFRLESGAARSFELERTIVAIEARVRATDDVGWLPAGDLGVLLREASVAEGLRLAQAIRSRAGAVSGMLACTAYGYPPFSARARRRPASRREKTEPARGSVDEPCANVPPPHPLAILFAP